MHVPVAPKTRTRKWPENEDASCDLNSTPKKLMREVWFKVSNRADKSSACDSSKSYAIFVDNMEVKVRVLLSVNLEILACAMHHMM